jgi:hypothetical protein
LVNNFCFYLPAIARQNAKFNGIIFYIVRKCEIIFSTLNENNTTLNIKSTLSKGTKLGCIVMITEGLLHQKPQE